MAGNLVQRITALVEGLVLTALGGAMLWFALSDEYWVLMNPKFSWLTGGAGALLAALGLATLFLGNRRGLWGRLGLMALMVLMIAGVDHSALLGPIGPSDPAPTSKAGPSRLEWQGKDYIKINAMELFNVAQQGAAAKTGEHYVWRAVARQAPGLGPRRFVALRTSVFCCLADAVAMGFVVQTPGPIPADGRWVRLWGSLQKAKEPIEGTGLVQTRGVFMSVASSDWFFRATRVEPMDKPEVPFCFVFKQDEPYAY